VTLVDEKLFKNALAILRDLLLVRLFFALSPLTFHLFFQLAGKVFAFTAFHSQLDNAIGRIEASLICASWGNLTR